ncbi:MAG: tyrosine-protein phosphatase, partial [Enterobacterales bacterium]|nr:tyrosine-protein phosphatase [Enterobacterales bacterium]MDN6227904.1 tyrosine-protein phosphatase [Enterobacterales bacterium]MDN6449949.1 tyrosine-protein phosphatase [Enterobacterales bacterium]
AIVQHCAVGKDRTGVGSALVLFALGADEATVMEDYLLTETTLAPFRSQMLDYLSIKLNEKALGQFSHVLSAREEFLVTALDAIKEKYSTVDRWLEQEYGLNMQVRSQLQQQFLEP